MSIKTLVVEDDPLARKRIEELLQNDSQIELVGSCGDGEDAVIQIEKNQPELIFLDIQLPGIDGFEILKLINPKFFPHIIFATAYDQYAVKAFEYNTIDYLLKPFEDQRFYRALNSAKERILHQDKGQVFDQVQSMLNYLKKDGGFLKRFLIKQEDRIHIIPIDEIQWIEADGYNMKIISHDQEYTLRETMKELESKLDPEVFLRIHRSYIINIDYVKEIQEWFKGDYMAILKNNKKLTISRSYYKKVMNHLKY